VALQPFGIWALVLCSRVILWEKSSEKAGQTSLSFGQVLCRKSSQHPAGLARASIRGVPQGRLHIWQVDWAGEVTLLYTFSGIRFTA